MGMCRPPPEVGEDLLDGRGLVNEGDDPRGAATPRAERGVGLIDLVDDVRPPVLEGPQYGGRWYLDHFGQRCFRLSRLGLLPLPPADVAVPAIVSDDMLARIGDTGGQGRKPGA